MCLVFVERKKRKNIEEKRKELRREWNEIWWNDERVTNHLWLKICWGEIVVENTPKMEKLFKKQNLDQYHTTQIIHVVKVKKDLIPNHRADQNNLFTWFQNNCWFVCEEGTTVIHIDRVITCGRDGQCGNHTPDAKQSSLRYLNHTRWLWALHLHSAALDRPFLCLTNKSMLATRSRLGGMAMNEYWLPPNFINMYWMSRSWGSPVLALMGTVFVLWNTAGNGFSKENVEVQK